MHRHYWETHYVSTDMLDSPDGMFCTCGETLAQSETEDLLNDVLGILAEVLHLYLPDEHYNKAIDSEKVTDKMKWIALKTPTAGDVRRWRKVLDG